MADETTKIADPAVVAQKAKIVGDEAVQKEAVEVAPDVTKEQVAAQVSPDREKPAAKVNVHETRIATDEVITDPSDPRAVQVPDAGKSPLLEQGLPAHRLAAGGVEAYFAENAAEADSDDDTTPAVRDES